MPDVDHPRHDLEPRRDACRLGALGEPGSVVEQNLVATDVDQERRQAGQVGEER